MTLVKTSQTEKTENLSFVSKIQKQKKSHILVVRKNEKGGKELVLKEGKAEGATYQTQLPKQPKQKSNKIDWVYTDQKRKLRSGQKITHEFPNNLGYLEEFTLTNKGGELIVHNLAGKKQQKTWGSYQRALQIVELL